MTAEKLGFGIKWLVRRLGSKLFSGSPSIIWFFLNIQYIVYIMLVNCNSQQGIEPFAYNGKRPDI